MFYKQVKPQKQGEMIAFLKKHPRYNTMNSWNRSTSHANCIKLHTLEKPADIEEAIWWELFTLPEWGTIVSDLIEDFGRAHNWQWQAGTNGRSGGYLVLYQGGIQPSGYLSYCTHCGQKNYQSVAEGQKGICGRCEAKARVNFKTPDMQIFTWPGKSVDQGEDFRDWSLSQLQDRVKLVQEFDQLCDSIVSEYQSTCRNYRIAEEQILVPKTIKILEPV
jgi:hypothetical protein